MSAPKLKPPALQDVLGDISQAQACGLLGDVNPSTLNRFKRGKCGLQAWRIIRAVDSLAVEVDLAETLRRCPRPEAR